MIANTGADLLFVFCDDFFDDVGSRGECEAQALGGGVPVGHVDQHLLRESAAKIAELVETFSSLNQIFDG